MTFIRDLEQTDGCNQQHQTHRLKIKRIDVNRTWLTDDASNKTDEEKKNSSKHWEYLEGLFLCLNFMFLVCYVKWN